MYKYVLKKEIKHRCKPSKCSKYVINTSEVLKEYNFPSEYRMWYVLYYLQKFCYYSPKKLSKVFVCGCELDVRFFDVTEE